METDAELLRRLDGKLYFYNGVYKSLLLSKIVYLNKFKFTKFNNSFTKFFYSSKKVTIVNRGSHQKRYLYRIYSRFYFFIFFNLLNLSTVCLDIYNNKSSLNAYVLYRYLLKKNKNKEFKILENKQLDLNSNLSISDFLNFFLYKNYRFIKRSFKQ